MRKKEREMCIEKGKSRERNRECQEERHGKQRAGNRNAEPRNFEAEKRSSRSYKAKE